MSKRDRILLWMVVVLWLFALMFVGVRHALGNPSAGTPKWLTDRPQAVQSQFLSNLRVKYFIFSETLSKERFKEDQIDKVIPMVNKFIKDHKTVKIRTNYHNGIPQSIEIWYVEKGE